MAHKIATCNYCGTRAALVLDRGRHELTCSACGAPLHEMKAMPQPKDKPKPRKTGLPAASAAPRGKRRKVEVNWVEERRFALAEERGYRPRKRKRRKSLTRKIFGELWDVVEDIID